MHIFLSGGGISGYIYYYMVMTQWAKKTKVERLKAQLNLMFKMNDFDLAKKILEMEIIRDRKAKSNINNS